ncbi:unnamed protein product [Rhizoctonia solani]|uniref:Geranylgeranyl pyrophosphate synthetase n=1 Tax=Rhizoctonia solani TaxID=456999 RepID=A0A8H2XUG2_9AGAM|nr:unnamed protein product [Rhizoctonia solani]
MSLLFGLSQVVATVPRPSTTNMESTPVEVTNLRALGSYNWIEEEVPTIAIPGRPAVWRDQTVPIHLREELGTPFFDENIARKCGFPLQPDLLAIEVCQAADPDFDLANEKIDIVTNRNNLRKLLSFANQGNRGRERYLDNFRIDVQLALNGRTMILTRYEAPRPGTNTPGRQQNHGSQRNNGPPRNNQSGFIGYDHIFERMCTQVLPIINAVDSSGGDVSLRPVGYHRIVRYDLLGLRFLVRSRVDAMSNGLSRSQPELFSQSEVDDLVQALQNTRLESELVEESPPQLQGEESGLQYVNFGEQVPQDLLMDIKLAPNGNVKWENVYPQFFLSQTPKLKVAARTAAAGSKYVTRLTTYDQNLLQAEHVRQAQRFRNLVAVLNHMREIIQAHGSHSRPLAFVWTQPGDMMVYNIEQRGEYLSNEGLDRF